MISTNTVTVNNQIFTKIVSDTQLIRKIGTGEIYAEAIDPIGSGRTYEETTELLPVAQNDYAAELENLLLEEIGV